MSVKERYIVGVDLGGTNIVAGAMPLARFRDSSTQTLRRRCVSVVDRIAGMIEQVIAQTMSETGADQPIFWRRHRPPGPLTAKKASSS
jgi:predicted NBD/HSP70 family sugar kinase